METLNHNKFLIQL